MKIDHIKPADIESASMQIIREELARRGKELPEDQAPVVMRVIHATADFEYADTMTFSPEAIEKGRAAIRRGARIVTDTNMALAGINKKALAQWGGEALCFMADPEVAQEAQARGLTRAAVSMQKAAGLEGETIFAIGNAPTALLALKELMEQTSFRPALIIGVPVGFVNVVNAKEQIMETDVPWIVNRGRKGGSGVAAAICNALLYGMRQGFTTGSCAAAAAAAAAQMLLTGKIVQEAAIRTPKGPIFRAQILNQEIRRGEGSRAPVSCRCAVRKDGGDDPDITTGTLIEAEVSWSEEPGITVDGGTGIGRVTKPGLDQPVGAAAINHVPREMIAGNVLRVWDAWKKERLAETAGNSADSSDAGPDAAAAGLRILISAPEGEALAERTFNPKLGIVGGISILGTTGIVEPMSDRAVVETIRAQLSVLKAEGRKYAVMAPGNYGLAFLTQQYGLQEEKVVLISNYAAEAVQLAAEAGFEGILLAGHIGKLVKIAGGARNTHSLYGDRRMEVLWEIARDLCREEDRDALQRELADCVMTDAALQVLDRYGVKEKAAQKMAGRICHYLGEWSGGRLRTETIVFSNKDRELVRTQGALELLGGDLS